MIIELKSKRKIDRGFDEQELLNSLETILDEVGYKAYEFSRSEASYSCKQKMRREIQLKIDQVKYAVERSMCMALGE